MKTDTDLIEEYFDLLKKFYSKNEAINIVVQNFLESTQYEDLNLKDRICEQYITKLLKNS